MGGCNFSVWKNKMKIKIKIELKGIPYEKSARRVIENKTFCENCDAVIYRNLPHDIHFCRKCVKMYFENYYQEIINKALDKSLEVKNNGKE